MRSRFLSHCWMLMRLRKVINSIQGWSTFTSKWIKWFCIGIWDKENAWGRTGIQISSFLHSNSIFSCCRTIRFMITRSHMPIMPNPWLDLVNKGSCWCCDNQGKVLNFYWSSTLQRCLSSIKWAGTVIDNSVNCASLRSARIPWCDPGHCRKDLHLLNQSTCTSVFQA